MPGLVPGIHVLAAAAKVVDGLDKPGHDAFLILLAVLETEPRLAR